MLDWLNQWELGILDGIQALFRCGFLDVIVPIFTFFGNAGWIWIVISVLLIAFRKHRKAGITLAVGLIAQLLVCNLLLKNLIARDRPCWLAEDVELLVDLPTDYSFPSGHTMVCFIAAAILAMYNRKWGYIAFPVAVLMGFTRLYLYVHFPTDVLGGAVLGVLLGAAVTLLMRKFFELLEKKYAIHL